MSVKVSFKEKTQGELSAPRKYPDKTVFHDITLIEDIELCSKNPKEFYIGDFVIITIKDSNEPIFLGVISYLGSFPILDNNDYYVNSIIFNKRFADKIKPNEEYPVGVITVLYNFGRERACGNRLSTPAVLSVDKFSDVFDEVDISLLYDVSFRNIYKVNAEILMYINETTQNMKN